MDSIRLVNYRCFEDTGLIKLSPINVLVGANSSGKSSFLKFFPLLKQSQRIRINGVFLWLGSNVDFKDFNNTVRYGEDKIVVQYFIKRLPVYKRYSNSKAVLNNVNVSFSIISENEHFDRIEEVTIKYLGADVLIRVSPDGSATVKVNNISTEDIKDLKVRITNCDATIPRLIFKYKDCENINTSFAPVILMHKMMSIANKLGGGFANRTTAQIFESQLPEYVNFKKAINAISRSVVTDSITEELYSMSLIYNIDTLIDSLNINFIKLAQNIVYVKPIRATIERYYRFQNLDMDEIDPDGTNLPMYLYNLHPEVQKEFNKWLRDFFGFELKIQASEGHIELLVSEDGNFFRNTVDLGFGYTQILPILAIVWKTIFLDSEKPRTQKGVPDEHIIVIEQPELHLHPKMQAKFARMIVMMAKLGSNLGIDLRFIIETHSEPILNAMGEGIEEDVITPDFINVLLVEQNKAGVSSIKCTKFNTDGFLEDWPRDFLEDVD